MALFSLKFVESSQIINAGKIYSVLGSVYCCIEKQRRARVPGREKSYVFK